MKEKINELAKIIKETGLPLSEAESEILADVLCMEGYEKKSEWISVKERMPEKGEMVLCYFKYEPESPDVICENTYHGGKLWLSEGSKVTHWMPLPELPKGE